MLRSYITLVGHAGQSSHPSTILNNMPIRSMAGLTLLGDQERESVAQNPNLDYPCNFLVIGLFMIVTLFTAFQEGYFPLISIYFMLYLLAGFGICFWLACFISTKHLLALILSIFDHRIHQRDHRHYFGDVGLPGSS